MNSITKGLIVAASLLVLGGASEAQVDATPGFAENARRRAVNDALADDLTRELQLRIRDDAALRAYGSNLRLTSVEGVVILQGTVDNTEDRRKLETIARGIAGRREFANEIQVQAR